MIDAHLDIELLNCPVYLATVAELNVHPLANSCQIGRVSDDVDAQVRAMRSFNTSVTSPAARSADTTASAAMTLERAAL